MIFTCSFNAYSTLSHHGDQAFEKYVTGISFCREILGFKTSLCAKRGFAKFLCLLFSISKANLEGPAN